MTNYIFIKNMSIDQMAKFLDSVAYDDAPWSKWFSEKYCNKCDTVMVNSKDYYREMECSYCEVEHKCRFFADDDDTWSDPVKCVKLWLEDDED